MQFLNFFGGEIIANHSSNSVEYEMYNEQLLACGGGGGGGGGGNLSFKTKKIVQQIEFQKRQFKQQLQAKILHHCAEIKKQRLQ